MTTKDLEEFQQLLKAESEEVRRSYQNHREDLPSRRDRQQVESGDWNSGLETEEVEQAILLNDERYLEKIQHALDRIEAGTYGKCEACSAVIPMERLRAKPSVSLCLECQKEKDRQS